MTGMDVLGLNLSNPDLISQKLSHAPPYACSASSSASSSSSSIFSLDGASSQGSMSSTSTNPVDVIWENGRSLPHSSESNPRRHRNLVNGVVPKSADIAVPPELRKHPRRTSGYVQSNGVPVLRAPPCLLRQSEHKVNFVDNLVDSASQIVEIIWPRSGRSYRSDALTGARGVLPLRTFIQETLRRSRTSFSTLQVALYYLIKVNFFITKQELSREQAGDMPQLRAMQCGRRMFLAALILASKYLQDRTYSARAWSKISGLNALEVNQNELMFLDIVQWGLHIPEATYHRWNGIVLKLTVGAGGLSAIDGLSWRTILPNLTPELENVDLGCATPPTPNFGGFDLDSLSPHSPPTCEMSNVSSSAGEPASACPRNIPRTLEPTPRMDYPSSSFPPVPRPPMLPIPQMAPQSNIASTPAASTGSFVPRMPTAISLAMNEVQNARMARSTLDHRPQTTLCPKANNMDGHPALGRRSSLARSNSSMSSPESMVSDASAVSPQSSQSSSSSVSSGASGFCAPAPSRLGQQAILRRAKSPLKDNQRKATASSPVDAALRSETCNSPDSYTGPIGQVPDLSSISLETPGNMNGLYRKTDRGPCDPFEDVPIARKRLEIMSQCRKRGRTGSEDFSIQNEDCDTVNGDSVLGGRPLASDFFLSEMNPCRKETAPHRIGPGGIPGLAGPPSVPLSGPAGMKRACCGSESARVALNPRVRAAYMG